MFVTRSAAGSIAGKGPAWLAYLDAGGVIITEYNISHLVYNEIYGTGYPRGPDPRLGDCRDNVMPSEIINPTDPFWLANNLPVTSPTEESCGYELNALVSGEPDVTPLGGWIGTGKVGLAVRQQGNGTLWLVDADWQDGENFYTSDSKALMGAFIAGYPSVTLWGISLNGYSSNNPGPSSLYQIDQITGAGTLVGSDLGYAVNSIAVDPTTGVMYASTTNWSGAFNGLLSVDTNTGIATEIGSFGSFSSILGLTFDSSGQLWGWHDPAADDPVRIDKTTGAATTVGNAGISTGGQVLAFDASDTLILIQGSNVYTIDQVTGSATFDSSLGFDPGSGGADFAPDTDLLWNARGRGRDLDSWIRITDVPGATFTDLDTDVQYLNALTFGGSPIAVNTPPVAVDDPGYGTLEDTILNQAAPGVLGNDTDADGDPLTAVLDSTTSNGGLTLNADGSFDYDPDANFCGLDSFTYHANDGEDDSNIATATITVTCVNDPPVANDDAYDAVEDTPLNVAAPGVLANDTDVEGDPLTAVQDSSTSNGVLTLNADGSFDYVPDANYCGSDSFTYHANDGVDDSNIATVTITVECVNDAPVAVNNNYTGNEDTQQSGNVIVDDTGEGVDFDVDGDGMTIFSNTNVAHGTLVLNADGSFTYDPNLNYCGPDSFDYVITDDPSATPPSLTSNTATVSITVVCVNDPPTVTSVVPDAQTSDYSDHIGTVVISVNDVDNVSTTLAESNEPPLSAAGLSLTSTGCSVINTESPNEDGSDCTWSYDGQVVDPGDNVYAILFTASDADGAGSVTGTHTLTIVPEEATVVLDPANDVALQVAEDGGNSGQFSLFFTAVETVPDLANIGSPEFGNLNEMVPLMTLVPVGPGGPIAGVCSFIAPLPDYPGEGYGQVALFECAFNEVPVNTYEVIAQVDGASDTTRYYTGADDAVLTIFDPSLGFTTGGGWFYWPGTADPELLACGEEGYVGDKTNFGFNMKYNKKRTNIQGSLLMMRHTVDANCEDAGKYRVKSNALDGLSIGEGEDADGPYGWAAFGGKSVFSEPGLDGDGNHPFLVYVEDHSDEGGNQDPADEFWIQVRDKDGNVVLETNGPDSDPAGEDGEDGDDVSIENGNIIVPHGGGGKGGKK